MFKIIEKVRLNATVIKMVIIAPEIAAKAQPGQFIILRVDELGERVPLTIADYDRNAGTITIIFQIVGAETFLLNQKSKGDSILDFVGPLGKPSHTEGLNRVAIVGGGVGCAIAYPVARKLYEQGSVVHSIIGFRTKDLVILEDEFRQISNILKVMTDDGSYGIHGLVTNALDELLKSEKYDEVIAIGPIMMMKFVSEHTKQYGIRTTVSMNPIMVDGTGMCGGCRLTVGSEVKFACVDGPDFDGHQVDFDRLMKRNNMYSEYEQLHKCRLFGEGVASNG